MQGPNPPISATAIAGSLAGGDADAAHAHDVSSDQVALDTAELRELERAEYYPERPVVPEPTAVPHRRSLLDRLFRR
jgi:hypothetical protein